MAGSRILVTGATGVIGTALVPVLRARGHAVTTHGWQAAADIQADLTRADQALALLDAVRPTVVINLVALNDVELCEEDPQHAYRINVRSVEHLAAGLRQRVPGCHLVQVSTDQVYDGDGPQREDAVCLRNVHAFARFGAELAALGVGAIRSTVLRASFFSRGAHAGPSSRATFVDQLHQALALGQDFSVCDDLLASPLAIDTLAQGIAAVVARRPAGIYNLGARGGMSQADFAFAYAEAAGLPSHGLCRASVAGDARTPARRPRDTRMDSRRIEQALALQLPELAAEIRRTASPAHATA